MAINKKLISFDKKDSFLGANGINNLTSATNGYFNQIPAYSLVFIKETGEIWHNGIYFGKPLSSQITSYDSTKNGILRLNGTTFKSTVFYLWGNTFDGTDTTINNDLTINNYWIFGGTSAGGYLKRVTGVNTSANVLSFSNKGAVTVANGLSVTSSNITTSSGYIKSATYLQAGTYLTGSYLQDTEILFDSDYTLGDTWTSIKLFNSSDASVNIGRPALLTTIGLPTSNWQPWITGASTDKASWGIGVGDAFYIGRVAKDLATNALTQYWKFDATGLSFSGTTKYITATDITENASKKFFAADGSLQDITELIVDYSIELTYIHDHASCSFGTSWTTDTVIEYNKLVNGVYALSINYDNVFYTGIMSWRTTTSIADEIILHACGIPSVSGQKRVYARTAPLSDSDNSTRLLIALEVAEQSINKFTVNLKLIAKL